MLYTKALTRSLFLSKTLFKGFKNELQKFDPRFRSPIQICPIFQKIKFRWENWTTLTNYKDSWHSNITVVACEQALLFRWARGRGKESLQRSLINFHLYFAQMKGNTIGWKVTFRKSKLIDNRPSWPALNLRGNVETRCSYRQNPCYVEDRSDRVCTFLWKENQNPSSGVLICVKRLV